MRSTVHFVSEESLRTTVSTLVAQETARILAVLPGADVQHVGATAIPGALTKGDVDLCVRVERAAFSAAEAGLAGLYVRNYGSSHTAGFAAFLDDVTSLPLGVQLCAKHDELDIFVAARDRLLADPVLSAAYDELKRRHEGADMDVYRAAKCGFWSAHGPW